MPFDLRGSARTATLTPGDRVKFRLSVKGGHSWVDRVEVVSAASVDAGLQTAVIDCEGHLAATVEGKYFTTTQLGDLVGPDVTVPA